MDKLFSYSNQGIWWTRQEGSRKGKRTRNLRLTCCNCIRRGEYLQSQPSPASKSTTFTDKSHWNLEGRFDTSPGEGPLNHGYKFPQIPVPAVEGFSPQARAHLLLKLPRRANKASSDCQMWGQRRTARARAAGSLSLSPPESVVREPSPPSALFAPRSAHQLNPPGEMPKTGVLSSALGTGRASVCLL